MLTRRVRGHNSVFHLTNASSFTAGIANWLEHSPAEISWDTITIRLFFSKAIWQFQHLKIPWPGALDPWERGHPENTTLCLLASDIPERALLLGRGGGRWWSWRGNLGQLGTKQRPQQPFQAINPHPILHWQLAAKDLFAAGSWGPRPSGTGDNSSSVPLPLLCRWQKHGGTAGVWTDSQTPAL